MRGTNPRDYSYIYRPNFPATGKTVAVEENIAEFENLSAIIICDWREIIYQMAIDYRQHNHEDDFT